MGAAKVYASLVRYFYWPKMSKEIHNYVRGCPSCQANKITNASVATRLKALEIPDRRWHTVSMDWITQLPPTRNGYDSILVCIDYVSK